MSSAETPVRDALAALAAWFQAVQAHTAHHPMHAAGVWLQYRDAMAELATLARAHPPEEIARAAEIIAARAGVAAEAAQRWLAPHQPSATPRPVRTEAGETQVVTLRPVTRRALFDAVVAASGRSTSPAVNALHAALFRLTYDAAAWAHAPVAVETLAKHLAQCGLTPGQVRAASYTVDAAFPLTPSTAACVLRSTAVVMQRTAPGGAA